MSELTDPPYDTREGSLDPATADLRALVALRAAAPDLYEVVVALVDLYDNEAPIPSRSVPLTYLGKQRVAYHRDVWDRARKALKKARAGVPDREKGNG